MESRPRLHVLTLAAACLAVLAAPAAARALLTQKEALKLAFPSEQPRRETAYLSEEQVRQAEASGRAKVESKVWTYYVGRSSAGVVSYAYFETHVVRAMPETFMAVLDAEGRLRFVELLAFNEPEDYLPRPRWLKQFEGKALKDELLVGRGIRNITGASLTSAALTDGVRRILAVHAVIHPAPAAQGAMK